MSGEWDWLQRGSPNHQAKLTPTDELIVSPNNSNEPTLKAFQAVAQVALKMEKAGEVNILKKHKSDRFSGGLYDLIILSRR
jgi:hypothetical protein